MVSLLKGREKNGIAKRVCVGECADSHSMGRLWKIWIDTVKECLMKRGLDVMQESRRVCEEERMHGAYP